MTPFFIITVFHVLFPFPKTDWMPQRRSRFNEKFRHPLRNPRSHILGTKSVFRDSSFLILLKTKILDSDFYLCGQLLNASELAKSRKTWPFFSEEICRENLNQFWSKWLQWKLCRTRFFICIRQVKI